MARYLIEIEGHEYDIELEYRSEKYVATLDGREIEIEYHPIGRGRSVMLVDSQSNEVDVRTNGSDGERLVFMRGNEITVKIENYQLAQLRKRVGMSTGGELQKIVKAPMPGLVLDIMVTAGEVVTKDQPLLIIEAMKMENIIKAPGEGTIKAVNVESKASVEKGDSLVELE